MILVNCGPPSLPDGGYISPYTGTLEGMEVTYICLRNQSITAICTKMGYWEPNSSSICAFDATGMNGLLGCSTLQSTFSQFTIIGCSSEALSQEGKAAVASSVTVFVVTSILLFTIGLLCGHFCQKKRKTTDQTIPLYDNVQPKHYEQELELKENMAYGHVHVIS